MKKIFKTITTIVTMAMLLSACGKNKDVETPNNNQQEEVNPTPSEEKEDDKKVENTLKIFLPTETIYQGFLYQYNTTADDVTWTTSAPDDVQFSSEEKNKIAILTNEEITLTATSPTQGTASIKVQAKDWDIFYSVNGGEFFDKGTGTIFFERQSPCELTLALGGHDEDDKFVQYNDLNVEWSFFTPDYYWNYNILPSCEDMFEEDEMGGEYFSKNRMNRFTLERFQKEFEIKDDFIFKANSDYITKTIVFITD